MDSFNKTICDDPAVKKQINDIFDELQRLKKIEAKYNAIYNRVAASEAATNGLTEAICMRDTEFLIEFARDIKNTCFSN